MDKILHCLTGLSSGNATRHDWRVRTAEQIRDLEGVMTAAAGGFQIGF